MSDSALYPLSLHLQCAGNSFLQSSQSMRTREQNTLCTVASSPPNPFARGNRTLSALSRAVLPIHAHEGTEHSLHCHEQSSQSIRTREQNTLCTVASSPPNPCARGNRTLSALSRAVLPIHSHEGTEHSLHCREQF